MEQIIVDEEVIIDVLMHKEELEERLESRLKALVSLNSVLKQEIYNSLPFSTAMTDSKVQTSPGKKDLGDVSLQIEEIDRRQRQSIKAECLKIQQQKEVINRIFICMETLPYDLWDILNKLYIEKKQWKELNMAQSTISKKRIKAITQILEIYHSSLDDCDIISYSTVFKKQGGFKSNKKKKHIKKETQIKGQINLEDMLDDN